MIAIHIFVPEQLRERLRRLKEITGISVSDLIRIAIDEYLRKHKI